MRQLLTGYVVNFNRRHRRAGHLFQDRYRSILCEDDPCMLELTRYIHLNPLRAGIVGSLEGLRLCAWCGHSAIMGRIKRAWQDMDTILAYFGRGRRAAIEAYERFVQLGVAHGRRPELVGGGLIRSSGGWFEVLSLRRRGERLAADERILGGGDFVQGILLEAQDRAKETLRLSSRVPGLTTLAKRVCEIEGVDEAALRSGSRLKSVVRARKTLCQLAVRKLGYPGAEVARFLGVTTSAVNRAAALEEPVAHDGLI
jgi:putative transposase